MQDLKADGYELLQADETLFNSNSHERRQWAHVG